MLHVAEITAKTVGKEKKEAGDTALLPKKKCYASLTMSIIIPTSCCLVTFVSVSASLCLHRLVLNNISEGGEMCQQHITESI